MNHQVEARIEGRSNAAARMGLHANVSVNVVVPSTVGFGAPPPPRAAREMKVDSSKVAVQKKS